MVSFAAVAAADETAHGPSFSADIVSRAPGEAAAKIGRIYVSNGSKVRIEALAAPSGYFLIENAAAIYVSAAQRIFMDAKQSTPLTQVFVPVSPENPCHAWLTAATFAGGSQPAWECQRVQAPAEADRGKREFQVIVGERNWSHRRVDSALKFPVRLLDADGKTIALEHVRIEAQLDHLFALPQGYRKWEPDEIVERIKHSDVWVGP
jgi:hypothetical protein